MLFAAVIKKKLIKKQSKTETKPEQNENKTET